MENRSVFPKISTPKKGVGILSRGWVFPTVLSVQFGNLDHNFGFPLLSLLGFKGMYHYWRFLTFSGGLKQMEVDLLGTPLSKRKEKKIKEKRATQRVSGEV